MTILIIDNDDSWLNLISSAITQCGGTVENISNVSLAKRLVKNTNFSKIIIEYQKAISDHSFSEIVNIQNMREGDTIVTFTTELTPSKVSEMFRLGVDDCIDKPYDMSQICNLIQIKKFKTYKFYIDKRKEQSKIQNILIVDDEILWRNKLEYYIKKRNGNNYHIELVDNINRAKENLSKQFDAIVLDLRLIDNIEETEHFEGEKLLKIMKESQVVIPIIVVSAYGKTTNVKNLYQCYPVIDYQTKQDFNRERFIESLKKSFSICFFNYSSMDLY